MINKALIEQKANDLYLKYYKTGVPANRMLTIIKKEGIVYQEREIGIAKMLGVLLTKKNSPVVMIIDTKIGNLGRKNFTIAHELGHYALRHYEQTEEFYCDESKIKDDEEATEEHEAEANHFASCFLLPKNKVINEFNKWYANKQFKGEIAWGGQPRLFVDFNNPKSKRLWGHLKGVLTKNFGVSETALKIRLSGLKLINDFKYPTSL